MSDFSGASPVPAICSRLTTRLEVLGLTPILTSGAVDCLCLSEICLIYLDLPLAFFPINAFLCTDHESEEFDRRLSAAGSRRECREVPRTWT